MKKINNLSVIICSSIAVLIACAVSIYFIWNNANSNKTSNVPYINITLTLNLDDEDKEKVDLLSTPVEIIFSTGQKVVFDDWQESVLLSKGQVTYTIQSVYLAFDVLSDVFDVSDNNSSLVLNCHLPTIQFNNAIDLTCTSVSTIDKATINGTKNLLTISIDKSAITNLDAQIIITDYKTNTTIKISELKDDTFINFIGFEIPISEITITQPNEPIYNYKLQLILTDGYIQYTSNQVDIHCYYYTDGQCYISSPMAVLNLPQKEVKV